MSTPRKTRRETSMERRRSSTGERRDSGSGKRRSLVPKFYIAVICNPETMVGFLLCGFNQIIDGKSNFLTVDDRKYLI